jgi:hypothetical protein
MAPIIVLFCLAAGAVLVGLIAHRLRPRNKQEGWRELHGDWWPRFEADFRAYAERWDGSRSARRRRPASQ